MVDVSRLAEAQPPVKKKDGRVFLFSFLGALLGSVFFVAVHALFSVLTAFLFLLTGVGAYAFYLYFIDKKDRRGINLLFIALACITAVVIAFFADILIVYAGEFSAEGYEGLNIFEKTAKAFVQNVLNQNFVSQYDKTAGQYYMSFLFMILIYSVIALIGLFLSWLYILCSVDFWEKRHGKKEPEEGYGYRSRKKRSKRKKS